MMAAASVAVCSVYTYAHSSLSLSAPNERSHLDTHSLYYTPMAWHGFGRRRRRLWLRLLH